MESAKRSRLYGALICTYSTSLTFYWLCANILDRRAPLAPWGSRIVNGFPFVYSESCHSRIGGITMGSDSWEGSLLAANIVIGVLVLGLLKVLIWRVGIGLSVFLIAVLVAGFMQVFCFEYIRHPWGEMGGMYAVMLGLQAALVLCLTWLLDRRTIEGAADKESPTSPPPAPNGP
jgi:hypothetical protein